MPLQQTSLRWFLRLMLGFSLFQRGLMPEKIVESDTLRDNEEPESSRIRCPICKWRPEASSRWQCNDCGNPEFFFGGCGTVWNTFDTHGLCPGCGHQWRWTGCLDCHQWSPHEEWYTKEAD